MHWLHGRPVLAGCLLAALLFAPAPLLFQLRLDNAPETYFPADAPAVRFNESVREDFPLDQVLVALFEGGDLFSDAFLERLTRLVEELAADPRMERVLAVSSVDHIAGTSEGFAVSPLVAAGDDRSPEERRRRALSDRFVRGGLVAEDGAALAVVVRPFPMATSLERLRLERLVRSAVARHGLDDRLTAVAGHIALDVAQLRAMVHDITVLVPATLLVSLLLLWWLFRRWLVLALAVAVTAAIIGSAIVVLAFLSAPFTLITAIAPLLLTAISVAMQMHLYNAVALAARRGLTGEARVRAALEEVGRPTVYAALTTAAGLLSLSVSPIRPIETLGVVAACGVVVAALVVLGPLPALLLALDRRGWPQTFDGLARLDAITGRLLRLALRHPLPVLAGAGGLLLLALSQLPRIEVETDLYAFFPLDHPISQATQRVESNLAGVMPLEVVFEGAATDSLKSVARLRAISDVQRWLDAQPGVERSLSLPDFLAEMHWAFHGEEPAYRRLPDSAPLIAQYLFVYDGDDLYDVVERDFRRSRILVNLSAHSAGELNALIGRLRARLREDPPADLAWDIAGMGRLLADQERLLIRGQIASLMAVVALIALLMVALWRSVALAAMSMIPNMAPVVILFGAMGLFGIWLDIATALVASVAVGIALDDTIHMMHGYLERRGAGCSPVWAVARTVRQRGRAICATTIVLCVQFLFMTSSPFQPTAVFGLLTALGLLLALAFDLLVLPAMLVLAGRSRTAAAPTFPRSDGI